MTKQTTIVAVFLAILAAPFPASAEGEQAARLDTATGPIMVEVLAGGLDHPWAVEPLPDGTLLVTERPGRLRLFSDGRLSDEIAGLPAIAEDGQGGLLDVAISREFATDRLIALTASAAYDDGIGTVVIRAKLSADGSRLEEPAIIYRLGNPGDEGRHFGSRILVSPDNTLFVTIGDRGDSDRAQDMFDAAGSVIHIDWTGKPAKGNPHLDAKTGLPELWTKGHRNPQGITRDLDGSILTVEHGARGGDEINRLASGRNYGWPVISYGVNYDGSPIGIGVKQDGMEQPIHVWDPSIAPSALLVYDGPMFPEWRGDIFVTALKYQLIARLDRNEAGVIAGEERLLADTHGRLRDLAIADDGALLVVTDEDEGQLLRISRPAEP